LVDRTLNQESSHELRQSLLSLLRRFAVVKKEVTLASGQTSSLYVDCRQVYFRGEAQFVLGELFFKKMVELEQMQGGITACGGMAMGSIPLSLAITSAAFRRGRELPSFAVRKETKDHGLKSAIEGSSCLVQKTRVLMVEDVVTTASSITKAVQEVREYGCLVDTVFCIVDREQGGKLALERLGINLFSLFRLGEL
jgi:orotate phosphoribosyltransferase